MSRFLLLMLLASACRGKHAEPAAPGSASPDGAPLAARSDGPCVALPFATSTPVPEASAAAWLEIDGKPELVVISDSGNDGAYGIVDPETGETHEQGKLPLGNAGEDIEGLAARGDTVYGLTSSGWMRAWRRKGAGFELVEPAYPLGPVTLSDKGEAGGNRPPKGDGMACGSHVTNCGRNYEGLCLVDRAHAKGPCVGFAASKADGHLYCLVEKGGKLVALHDRAIAITKPGALADCAFSVDDGTLWAGSNLFDLSEVYRVDGWDDPATAKVVELAQLGIGFPETIAARGDVIYRMSDTGGAPSLMNKFRCRK